MSITVELTYDMGKALGARSIELDAASTVKDALTLTQQRFLDAGADYALLTRVAAVAVNGVLINHRRGMKTKLSDGDRVAFLKAAAGG